MCSTVYQRPKSLGLLSVLLILCLIPSAYAKARSRLLSREQVAVQADQLDVDNQKKWAHFYGHVQLQQGHTSVQGNDLVIHYNKTQIESLRCTGHPVRFTLSATPLKPVGVSGTADDISYAEHTNQWRMRGHVHLQRGQERLDAADVRYNPTTDQWHLAGDSTETNKPIQIILPPSHIKTADVRK